MRSYQYLVRGSRACGILCRARGSWALGAMLACAWGLSACGGGSSGMLGTSAMSDPPAPSTGYQATALVANSSAISALHADPNLVNAWGLAFNPQGFAWVANAGSSTTTLYDGNGTPSAAFAGGPAAITIVTGETGSAGPTGVVFNPTSDFVVSAGAASAPALFLYATLSGTIEGWAEPVSPNSAVIAYDGAAGGAVYTGLTLARDGNGSAFLYAADFHNGKVDVFNSSFAPVQVGGGFFDAQVPQGFAPYGIQNIPASDGAARIYVAYAQPDTATHNVSVGVGLGYVAVFDAQGTLIAHLVSQGSLNAPWGLAIAPSNFGSLSGALLVGNFGDGMIHAYDAASGASMGSLTLSSGQPFVQQGLWALAFGNGLNSQPSNTLFFTAGPNAESAGVFGRVDLAGAYTPPSMMAGGY